MLLKNGLLASSSCDRSIKLWNLTLTTGLLVKTFLRHTDCVSYLVELKNGALASCSFDKRIILWNVDSGQMINSLVGHYDRIRSITELDNGYLASASEDNLIKIWDYNKGISIKDIYGHSASVISVIRLSPSNHFASSSMDSTIKVWNISGFLIRTLKGHSAGVSCLVQLDDMLISGGEDKRILFWNISSGNLIRSIVNSHNSSVYNLARLNNKMLASSANFADQTVKVWDRNGKLTRTIETGIYQSFIVDSNNKQVAIGYPDNKIRIWERGVFYDEDISTTPTLSSISETVRPNKTTNSINLTKIFITTTQKTTNKPVTVTNATRMSTFKNTRTFLTNNGNFELIK